MEQVAGQGRLGYSYYIYIMYVTDIMNRMEWRFIQNKQEII